MQNFCHSFATSDTCILATNFNQVPFVIDQNNFFNCFVNFTWHTFYNVVIVFAIVANDPPFFTLIVLFCINNDLREHPNHFVNAIENAFSRGYNRICQPHSNAVLLLFFNFGNPILHNRKDLYKG